MYTKHAITIEDLLIGFHRQVLNNSIVNGLVKLENLKTISLQCILGSMPVYTIFEKIKTLNNINMSYDVLKSKTVDYFSEIIITEENTKINHIGAFETKFSNMSLFILANK